MILLNITLVHMMIEWEQRLTGKMLAHSMIVNANDWIYHTRIG